jgi:hypothetical protein
MNKLEYITKLYLPEENEEHEEFDEKKFKKDI